MPATLKDAISSLKSLTKSAQPTGNISDELLGKYEGIIPVGKTSAEFIKDLRKTMFETGGIAQRGNRDRVAT